MGSQRKPSRLLALLQSKQGDYDWVRITQVSNVHRKTRIFDVVILVKLIRNKEVKIRNGFIFYLSDFQVHQIQLRVPYYVKEGLLAVGSMLATCERNPPWPYTVLYLIPPDAISL
jgi:hypothetical protein